MDCEKLLNTIICGAVGLVVPEVCADLSKNVEIISSASGRKGKSSKIVDIF